MNTLREYQRACVEAIAAARDRGVKSMLSVMACGLGKSFTLGRVPKVLQAKRTLALAHRLELVDQLAFHLQTANPDAVVSVEQADRHEASPLSDIVVGCVPTLAKDWRRHKFASWRPDLVMYDEVQHLPSASGQRIIADLAADATLIGWTATPMRGDKRSLSRFLDELVYDKSLRPANGEPSPIDEGWLCHCAAQRVRSSTSIADISLFGDDFDPQQLSNRINTGDRNSLIYSAIERHAVGRRSILVFAASVGHAEALAAGLTERGETAACVSAHTAPTDRRNLMRAFASGDLRVLINVGIYTEGTDMPWIDCLVMGRPTRSALLYQQMVGRSLRQSPETGKVDALILDVVDVCGKHPLQTAAQLFGAKDVDCQGRDALAAARTCERAADMGIVVQDGDELSSVERKIQVREAVVARVCRVATTSQAIDLFNGAAVLGASDSPSIFPWVPAGAASHVLMLGGDSRVTLKRDALGIWRCDSTGRGGQRGENCGCSSEPPWKAADRCVKKWAGTWRPSEDAPALARWRLLTTDSPRWRKPVSAKTIKNLRGWGVEATPPGLSEGAAMQLLASLRVLSEARITNDRAV